MTGIIIMYHPTKKFGFIRTDAGTDHFFHFSNLVGGLDPVVGTRVSFQLVPPMKLGKQPQAASVCKAGV